MKWLDKFVKWSKLAPLAYGQLKNGDINDALECEHSIVLIIDSRGRVFQCDYGTIMNCQINQVFSGRTATIEAMDRLGVEDMPSEMINQLTGVK